ncbi:MAG: hypothetical protein VX644_04020 [Planctomycetota bacterium]|nr:hypothetical protein [Planctomycetota bacterium]
MKKQTLLLVLVAVMGSLGVSEAFCQAPQRGQNSRFKSHHKLDVEKLDGRRPQRANAAVEKSRHDMIITELPDWLKDIIGPWPPGSPGPTFPEPHPEEFLGDLMNDVLDGKDFPLANYDYDVPVFNRRKPQNRAEGAFCFGHLVIIVRKDAPVIILDIDDLVENPAEYEGSDGDDIWDVLQGR